jgi:hypothetical protein
MRETSLWVHALHRHVVATYRHTAPSQNHVTGSEAIVSFVDLFTWRVRAVCSCYYTDLNDWMNCGIMNCKRPERQKSWPNLRYHPNSCSQGPRETKVAINLPSVLADMNPWPAEKETWKSVTDVSFWWTELNVTWLSLDPPPPPENGEVLP